MRSRWVWWHPTFNPRNQETESDRSLSSKPSWSTDQVPEQLGLHKKTLSEKQKQTKQTDKETKKKRKEKMR